MGGERDVMGGGSSGGNIGGVGCSGDGEGWGYPNQVHYDGFPVSYAIAAVDPGHAKSTNSRC